MENDLRTSKLIAALQKIMKKEKRTYAELADYLQVSLPTVKRMFSIGEMSISRLMRVCEFLAISFSDLAELCRDEKEGQFQFSKDTETFFSQKPHYLAYLFQLIDGKSPTEIENQYKISSYSTKKYLQKLTELKLIRYKEDQLITLVKGSIVWDDEGILGQTFTKSMIESFSKKALTNLNKNHNMLLHLNGWQLSNENYLELKEDLTKLCQKYRQLSNYNKRIFGKDALKNYSFMAIADNWEEKLFSKISELKNV